MTSDTILAHNPVTGQLVSGEAGPRSGWMTITPEQAQNILDERNVKNRKLTKPRVNRYARDMTNGVWLINGDAIRFATDGTLLDGQHRLAAIVKSGVTLRLLVVWNLPHESQATMDDGWKRTMAGVLEIDGQGKGHHTKTLASVLRRGYLWDHGYVHSGNEVAPTKSEMNQFLTDNPRTMEAAEIADRIRHQKGVKCAASTMALAYFLFDRIDPELADEFFQSLRSGAGLQEGSPILVLRNKLSYEGSTRVYRNDEQTLCWFIKAWNAWREHRTISILRWKPSEEFPVPR